MDPTNMGTIQRLAVKLVLISLISPYRTVGGVLVVMATELLLNMRKLKAPSVLIMPLRTNYMVVDGLMQSSVTVDMYLYTIMLVAIEMTVLEI